ncbi:synaptotagmin-like protein 2 isoform X2 [Alosa sapidissima]|uniref:synaptotagmin-like protein 2 isoform X2 n=1 Tax=Alosa sapidissima TaxID=34773 RepID=UPI001C080208|nr:synaptotagmin-like protein 2 isoform X2 [Alosa sapidissima]
MKPSAKFPELLDLSFLSADEEAAILKVLQRDEELRKFDTGRQRRLKATTPDPKQVRVMTGEWFEDLKTKRYGQPCDITAVVKSSMRRKRTPAPKINPFMTYTATEARGDSNQLSTSRHLPAFAEETYREYTDEDFNLNDEPSSSEIGRQKSPSYNDEGAKQPAGKSSNPFLNAHTPASAAASAPDNHSPGVNDLPPAENRSFAFMPFKSSATPKDAVTPAESSRMVSLPPALRKGASVEDSWVKISVEPNTVAQSDLRRDGCDESEAHTSCSSSDSEESQSVPQTPFEPVLLQYKENVSDNVNISHVRERPLPHRRTFVKRSADSDKAERSEPETTSSLSSNSTTEPTEVISYEAASFRSQSSEVTSCSSSESADVLEKSAFEMEGPEGITLKKQPRMDFGYPSQSATHTPQVTGIEEFENIQVLSSVRDVDSSEKESQGGDSHASAYIFGKMASHSAEFKSKETEDETVGENKALGIKHKAFEPAQLNKAPSAESQDSPVDICESIQYAGREQPEDKLVDFGKSPEVEYEIPKLNAHSFTVAHAEDEMLSSELSSSQFGDRHHAKQTENNYIREVNFEVRTKEDELGGSERGTEMKLPSTQTEVPWGRDQMELHDSLPEIRPGGDTHSSSLTMSGSVKGEIGVALNTPANGVLSARMKPPRAYRVLPLQSSDDHMTSGQDAHTSSEVEEVAVGEIRGAAKPPRYDQEDTWPSSPKSQEVNRDMALGTSSSAPGLDEETVSTGAPWDTEGDVGDVVELSGSDSTESVILNETLSGDGRQEMRKRDADLPERVESAGSPFEVLQGNPFAFAAVGGVRVSEERSVTPEHVSSSVDVRPLRPEDQPDPTVQLGNGNYKIPAIVVMPSEQASGIKEGGSQSEATKGIIASNAEWEDEGLDSGDDQSSVSSYGSELSGRKSHLSNALSAGRMGSLMSIYSDAGDYGNVLVQGAVEFAMMYSPAEELIIMVEQCQDLAYGSARKQRTDPYVKTYLLPDRFRRTKRKTSIKKNTNSPVYVESLRYKIKKKDLMDKMLHLSVWHNDSRGRNVFLGQVELNLKTWDWGHEALTWYNLQAKGGEGQESQDYRGTLFVALKYTPAVSTGGSKQNTGEVHVWLKEAKDLCQLKSNSVDSFVKCYMLPDTSKKSRQKTRVVKKSLSPVYNHAMVFDGFRAGEVREACCELTVWEHHKLSNQFLGGLRLSAGTGESYGKQVDWMDSVNQEVEIWEQMLAKPNNWVEAVIPLRSSMTPRK